MQKYNKYLTVIAFLILAMNVGWMLWYAFIGYQAFFHSDSSAKVLLAAEIYTTGDFFPNEWNYVNGDIFIVFGHLFIIPIIGILKGGFLSHAVSSAALGILTLLGVYLVARLIALPRSHSFAITSAIAAGISGFVAENLYGQGSYGAIFCISLYLIYFYLKSKTYSSAFNFHVIAFLVLLFLVVWSNPLRSLISYVLPVLGALTLCNDFKNQKIYYIKNIFLILAATAIGLIAHKYTLSSIHNTAGVSSALWLAPENMLKYFLLTWKGIFSILGGLPPENSPVTSLAGGVYACRLITCLLMLWLIPLQLKRILSGPATNIKFIGYFTVMALGLTFFIMTFTTVPDMNDPVQSSRYLVPPIILAMILCFSYISRKSPKSSIVVIACIASYVIVAPIVYVYSDNSSRPYLNNKQARDSRYELIEFLKVNKLHYGYGGYWNSGVVSVLSDEEVRVRQITLDRGMPKPSAYLSSNSWYKPGYWTGETFLLLTYDESKLIDWKALADVNIIPSKILDFQGMKIFVFDKNLADIIPGWSSTL